MPLTPELKTHFLNLYHMALSDANVDMKELETLYLIGESRGIARAEIDALLLEADDTGFSIPESVIDKIDYLYDLSLIACADGIVDEGERQTIAGFCSRFGFQDENIQQICDLLLEEAAKKTPKAQLLSTISQNL